jgi:DNA-binding Lrp family transcriptional regulator
LPDRGVHAAACRVLAAYEDFHANRLASLPGVATVTSYVTMKTLSADTARPAGRRRLERHAN